MNKRTLKKLAALLLVAVLALSVFTGCGAASSSAAGSAASSTADLPQVVHATFRVTGPDGAVTEFELIANEGCPLSEALLLTGILLPEEAVAGYVTYVNGIVADWDADGAWWCLVDANGEMTAVGIADIKLAEGDVYGFVYTVGY